MAEQTAGTTGEVQRALDVLAERAWEAGARVSGAEGLTLAEAVTALESVGNVLEAVGQVLEPLTGRIEQIRDREMTEQIRGREMTERRGGTELELMDGAGVTLAYGRDAVMVAFHLLEVGRAGLARVAQGEA